MSTKTRHQIEYHKRDLLARSAGLLAFAISTIGGDQQRPAAMIQTLLRALQLFKENRLAAVVAIGKSGEGALPENFQELMSLRIENFPVSDRIRRVLSRDGVWYVGELYRYLVWLETKRRQRSQLVVEVSETLTALALPLGIDPIEAGWHPPYWDSQRVLDALNTPVIKLQITSDDASFQHRKGNHYVGTLLHSLQGRLLWENAQGWLAGPVGVAGLHAGMYLPPDWMCPSEVPEAWIQHVGKTQQDVEQNLTLSKLQIRLEELVLSVRATNCCRCEGLIFIGDVVQKSEDNLLRSRNLGRKTLKEIKERLQEYGLALGMRRDHPVIAEFNATRTAKLLCVES